MFTLKSFCAMWFLLGIISDVSPSDYLHFGGTEEESRQAAYYLSADSGADTGPTDELRRTQRSFWRKLFKHGLFGECDNCCNNCNYNVGNGDSYNPLPSPLLPFQPWRPLPLLQPLQPLFSSVNYDNYGTSRYNNGNSNNYGNPPSYGMNTYGGNGVNGPPSYGNSVPTAPAPAPAPEPVYEIPTELPPAEPDYQIDNTPVAEDTYEAPSKQTESENSYSIPEPLTYTNDEKPKGIQYSNGKVPQIIYQPIIYVSPQYQGNKELNQVKQEEPKYNEEYKGVDSPQAPSYETESDTESEQHSYGLDTVNTKSDDSSNSAYNIPESQTPVVETPSSQTYVGPYTQQTSVPYISHPPTNPSVSTVSAIYNIISPSLLHSLTTGQSQYPASAVIPNVPCLDGGPSKYSLYSSNMIPVDSYSVSTPASRTTTYSLPPPIPTPSPIPSPPLAQVPSTQTYIQPIHLTSDDQPYRVCPELFDEYKRKLNAILPHFHDVREGSSFVNAQLVHY